MPDYTYFFDKRPTLSYSLGPTGDVLETGFNQIWNAWHVKESGIFFSKTSEFQKSKRGAYLSGSSEILNADNISFAFDKENTKWVAANNGGIIDLYRFSGNAVDNYTFDGYYPQVFYNSAEQELAKRKTYCFYNKSGENKIFVRSRDDLFAEERIYQDNLEYNVALINQVFIDQTENRRFCIFGKYDNGQNFKLTSESYPLFWGTNIENTGFFQSNFELIQQSAFSGLNFHNYTDYGFGGWGFWTEDVTGNVLFEKYPSGYIYSFGHEPLFPTGFVFKFGIAYEDFTTYPTGDVIKQGIRFVNGINMPSGTIIPAAGITYLGRTASEDFTAYETGDGQLFFLYGDDVRGRVLESVIRIVAYEDFIKYETGDGQFTFWLGNNVSGMVI